MRPIMTLVISTAGVLGSPASSAAGDNAATVPAHGILTVSARRCSARVRQLRDPCVFQENGRTCLFYTIAGEMGIALAELDIALAPRATPHREPGPP